LKTIIGFATSELFVIDNYLDNQPFDIYMGNVTDSVSIRVMTNQVSDALRMVAEKFSKRGNFQLKSSKDVHDRVVFADGRCWVIGQSRTPPEENQRMLLSILVLSLATPDI
jgi:hypothetical protein